MGRQKSWEARKSGNRAGRLCALAVLVLSMCVPFGRLWAQGMEYEVKAAFIYNFLRFVEWPGNAFSGPDAAINLWVFGHDGVADAAAALSGKTAKGRKIVVKRVSRADGLDKCQVLFLARSEQSHAAAMLRAVRGAPVLTIADFPGFARSGGIINFILADRKVSFEINQDSAEKSGLRISSQLLKLAKIVQGADKREER